MPISEGVQSRIVYKAYSSGSITANSEPNTATDPGTSGGQVLRRVSSSLNLVKDSYQSEEIRTDRQIADFRHGLRRVEGSISGELSPGTQFELLVAAHRDSAVSSLSLSNTQFTSVTSDNSTSAFVFTAGDPVTSGLRVGDIIRFGTLAETANNDRNFVIRSFGGTSNRTVTVSPAPTTDAVADTTFTVTRPGKTTIVPASSFTARKFGIEEYREDLDLSRLFTECRVSGYSMSLPATGLSTVEIPFMGRNAVSLSAGSAPYFTAPTAATTTSACASANGLILSPDAGSSPLGIVTGIDIALDLEAEMQAVINQNIAPEIFLGRANVTGTVSAFVEDFALFNAFLNESELQLIVRVDSGSAANADAICIYLPRVKLGGADMPLSGANGQTISLPFQALRYTGSAAGRDTTTIRIHDTAA
jgi:hypothetical protein